MGRIWTEETMYQCIKAFVLAEGRYPTAHDYGKANGLPSHSSTAYRHCPHFRQRLASEGIVCAYIRPGSRRPRYWHTGTRRAPDFTFV